MKHTPVSAVLVTLVFTALGIAACGDDAPAPRTALLPAQPVVMSDGVRGLTAYYTQSLGSIDSRFMEDLDAASNIVLVEQVYSEFEHVHVGGQPRAPEPRIDYRMAATYADENVGPLIAAADDLYWVVDLQRLDREWLVDWNGLARDEPDVRATALTFSKRRDEDESDYQEAVIERVTAAFEDADPRPASVIIGSEMERHYAAAPEDWPAFAEFVRDLTASLRAVDPGVRLAVGMNWSNFVQQVVPRFVAEAGAADVNFQVIRAAWEAVIDPLYIRQTASSVNDFEMVLDFYAFAAVPDTSRVVSPNDLPEDHFTGVATFFDEYPAKALPVAWHAVGWPSEQPSSGNLGDFWEFFSQTAGGTDIELIAWWGYSNLVDASDCRTMTDSLGLSRTACYRGLYSSSGSPISGLRDEYFANAN